MTFLNIIPDFNPWWFLFFFFLAIAFYAIYMLPHAISIGGYELSENPRFPCVAVEQVPYEPLKALAEYARDMQMPLLKLILGIPLDVTCSATTAYEAQCAFHNSESGTDAELAALLKWIELSDDIFTMDYLCGEAERYHPYVGNIATKKWDTFVVEMCDGVTEETELKHLYQNAPCGGDSEVVLLKKMYQKYKN